MAPRLDPDHVKIMKQTLLQRLPQCVFTEDDVAAVVQATGLMSQQVLVYAKNLRARLATAEERHKELEREEDAELIKVCLLLFAQCVRAFFTYRARITPCQGVTRHI